MAHEHPPQIPDRRSETLALATEAFVTHGYAGTSMAGLERAVGIRKASLHHHFPSKEALFIACVTEDYAGAVRRREEIRDDPSLSDAARIRTAMEEICRPNMTTPVGRMAPLVAGVTPAKPDVARAFHGGFIARHHALVTRMIKDVIARGSFAPLDPLGVRQMIFGRVILLAMEREMTASYPVERIRESHIALVLRPLTGAADRPAGG